jgi:ArsR family transcriptional regulator
MYIGRVTTATAARTAPDLDRAVALFHALSDATRLSILEMLRGGERCVCELQDELGAAQSRLSFHLRVLKDAGLVTDRREGRWSYYSIEPDALAEVHDLAVGLQPKPGARAASGKGVLRVLRAGSCCR